MSAPAPPNGCCAPQPSPFRPMNGFGTVSFVLGLMVAFGLVVYTTWLAFAAVTAVGDAAQRVGSSATGSTQHGSTQHGPATPGPATPGSSKHAAGEHIPTAPPVAAVPGAPTPSGSILAFDQLWTSSDGNTVVAGAPTVGTSAHTGESVIQIAVTLTNNTERNWNPVSTTFAGTLNRAPAPESAEGDWMYSAPILPHTSVTLTKVFLGRQGQFTLTVSTPHGAALFTGRL